MFPEFVWTIRVYYEDTDAGGVVFYANYLKFFERARTEWLRAAGVNQHAMKEEQHTMFVVKTAAVDYHSPAKLDDELKLHVRVEKLGRASVHFRQEAWRENGDHRDLLAVGHFKVGCIHARTLRPDAIPEAVLMKIHQLRGET